MARHTQERFTARFADIKIFTLALAIYLTVHLWLLVTLGYEGSFLYLNKLHVKALDMPMFLLTQLGDGIVLTAILVLFFSRALPHYTFTLISVVILTGILVQVLKLYAFPDWERPLTVFEGREFVHTVIHYKLYFNSFPSGHSTTIAAAMTTTALSFHWMSKRQLILALIVMVVSYTRIYLGVHFPGDVIVGILIGFLAGGFLTKLLLPYFARLLSRITEKQINLIRRALLIIAALVVILDIISITYVFLSGSYLHI